MVFVVVFSNDELFKIGLTFPTYSVRGGVTRSSNRFS